MVTRNLKKKKTTRTTKQEPKYEEVKSIRVPVPAPNKTGKVGAQVDAISALASSIIIANQEAYENAAQVLIDIKSHKKKVEELFGPQAKAAYDAWQTSLAQKKKFMKPLQDAEKVIKEKVSDYEIEQERLERERIEAAAKEAALAEAEMKAELDAQIEEAEDEEEKEILMESRDEVYVPIVTPKPTIKKSTALASQKDIKIEVTDPIALLKAVVNGKLNLDINKLVNFKVGVIKSYAKATGTKAIPGVKIIPIKRQLTRG